LGFIRLLLKLGLNGTGVIARYGVLSALNVFKTEKVFLMNFLFSLSWSSKAPKPLYPSCAFHFPILAIELSLIDEQSQRLFAVFAQHEASRP
jgi:hypothetical protein